MLKLRSTSRLVSWGIPAAIAVVAGIALFATQLPAHAEAAVAVPAAVYAPADDAASETAILSGGCFWAMQGVYEHVKGVTRVAAGYTGGAADTAQYEDHLLCTDFADLFFGGRRSDRAELPRAG